MQLELDLDADGQRSQAQPRNKQARAAPRGLCPEQGILPGCAATQLNAIFFAIRPSPAAADAIDRIASTVAAEQTPILRRIGKPRLHISVHGLGMADGMPNGLVARAREAASAVTMPPFELAFDRVVSFGAGEKRALVLRCGSGLSDLRRFHRLLGEAMARTGLGKHVRRAFEPHVAMLYDQRDLAERTVEPVRWTVRDFVLVSSPHGTSRHDRVAGWDLRG